VSWEPPPCGVISIVGHDPVELASYQNKMQPSRGNKKGGPGKIVKLLGRDWYVDEIQWRAFDAFSADRLSAIRGIIYEIKLKQIMRIT
jgi:hypothetical protein